jgi:hypothetical protein
MKNSPLFRTLTCTTAGLILSCAAASAQVIDYATAESTYAQDFDALGSTSGTWTNGSTLNGWYYALTNGSPSTVLTASSGDPSVQNQALTLGNSSDRALGSQSPSLGGAGYNVMYYGAAIVNNTGSTLSSFTLTYTLEQWRVVGSDSADIVEFTYQVFDPGTGSLTPETGWISVNDLTTTTPISGGSTRALNGNLSENQVTVTATVTLSGWTDGQVLWIRWSDENDRPLNVNPEQRQMLGIDDLSFSASSIPEPASVGLLTGSCLLLLALLRRRHSR